MLPLSRVRLRKERTIFLPGTVSLRMYRHLKFPGPLAYAGEDIGPEPCFITLLLSVREKGHNNEDHCFDIALSKKRGFTTMRIIVKI